ncbi:MAG: hypothetical protein NW218_21795 [Saprospiraceae bacterium]|nr:hypothetical protein [Saprospiraceae bacterium]
MQWLVFPFSNYQSYDDNQCQPNEKEVKELKWHAPYQSAFVEDTQNRVGQQQKEQDKNDDQSTAAIAGHVHNGITTI